MFSEKAEEKLREYDKRFGGFPTMVINSDEEIIKIVDDCLKQGKDVFDAGYLDINLTY